MNIVIIKSYGKCETCNECDTETLKIKMGSLVSPTHDIEICVDCAYELGHLLQKQF